MSFTYTMFTFMPFWLGTDNDVFFWRAVEMSNRMGMLKLTIDFWAKDFIKYLPRDGPWMEISNSLRARIPGKGWCPFAYFELVLFWRHIEPMLEHQLGHDPITRQAFADQLVGNELVTPSEVHIFGGRRGPRLTFERERMRALIKADPKIKRYKRVATMWVRWVDSMPGRQIDYPRGWRNTMFRMRELVDNNPRVKYATITQLEALLAPPSPTHTTGS